MVDDRRRQRPLFDEAVRLAREAELRGNLPIGAVVALDGEIIARGMNAIWHPRLSLTRHAEIVALEAVPVALWDRASEMTLVTTLEPCVMCAGRSCFIESATSCSVRRTPGAALPLR